VRLVGRGHPAVRGTHRKTFELARDAEITERATCVLAVQATGADRPLAGPVRITISAGGESYQLTARANPAWDPAGPVVVRRSPLRLPGTLATHASASAADLPRPLVALLRSPDIVVTIDVEPVPGPPTVVLFALDPDQPGDLRLAAELAAADVVLAEDEPAARLLGRRMARGPVDVTSRVLVVATRELPGATVAAALRHVRIETVGLAAQLAAAAAAPSREPVLLAGAPADLRAVLRTAPVDTRLVLRAGADRVADALRLAAELRGRSEAVVVQPAAPPQYVAPGAEPELASSDDAYLCLVAASESGALDPPVRAAVSALLADGVPTRAVAKALAALTGWDRRRAYQAVLGWRS
jgi:hypothetical protein